MTIQHLVRGALALALLTAGLASTDATPIHRSAAFPQDLPLTGTGTPQQYVGSVVTADFDGDGWMDVAAGAANSTQIAWYRNNGNGTFQRFQVSATFGTASLCAADLDGDGRPDLVASAPAVDYPVLSKIAWFRNVPGPLGGGLFDPTPRLIIANYDGFSCVTTANYNADVYRDILATSFGPSVSNPGGAYVSKVSWFGNNQGNVPGVFGTQNLVPNPGYDPTCVQAADLDGNGILDLVVTSLVDNTLAWFQGVAIAGGIPQFTRHVIANDQSHATFARLADFDGDGWLDIVCSAPGARTVTCFRNNTHTGGAAPPYFGPGQIVASNLVGDFTAVAADLDGDGFPDLISASVDESTLAWYRNLGTGAFGWNAGAPDANKRVIPGPGAGKFALATADFNRDGMLDIVCGSFFDGRVAIFQNGGGQIALTSANTAPSTIDNGARDDVLRILVSNRGLAGDDSAQLTSLTLFFEKSAGVPLTSAEADALIANLHIYADSNQSGVFEPNADALVASMADLPLIAGRLTVAVNPANAADALISAAGTRGFFVVPEISGNGSALAQNSFRVTHVGQGAGNSLVRDAVTATPLTLEVANNPDVPSDFVTATYSTTTPIQAWRQTWFGTTANSDDAANTANPDHDWAVNLIEFAFGTNPTVGDMGPVTFSGNFITAGSPTTLLSGTSTGVDFRALFSRRKDYLNAGLTYTVEFSADLLSWVPSTEAPTVIADDNILQAVTVPYPFFINGKKARFFHVVISTP